MIRKAHWTSHLRHLSLLALTLAASLTAACATELADDVAGPDVEDVASDGASAELAEPAARAVCPGDEPSAVDPNAEQAGLVASALSVTDAEVTAALRNATISSTGLPLWQSRPGANIALYLDFDGGTYGGTRYGAASLDSDKSRFSSTEQRAILRAALEVTKSYAGYNVNVTTDRGKMTASYRWTWMLITNDEGTSGEAWIDVMHRRPTTEALGFAGAAAVFNPPAAERGYLLTHELGHNFGLQHSGRWVNGRFLEWEELKESRTGEWMGGRDSYFTSGYKWRPLQTEDSQSTQDPDKIITRIAGRVGCSATSPQCSASCPCSPNERRDCDSNSECIAGLVCVQQSGDDFCRRP
jgi:Metallo-peptidase family M12B Reprolysin-like